MPNIAEVLKQEIIRLARKQLRAEIEPLKRALAASRSDLVKLKARIGEQDRVLAKLSKTLATTRAVNGDMDARAGLRFSAKGLASHRARLGLPAQEFARLVGVTPQSIYAWEAGRSSPRKAQLEALAAVRKMGKRQAAEALASSK